MRDFMESSGNQKPWGQVDDVGQAFSLDLTFLQQKMRAWPSRPLPGCVSVTQLPAPLPAPRATGSLVLEMWSCPRRAGLEAMSWGIHASKQPARLVGHPVVLQRTRVSRPPGGKFRESP